jgi:putative RNA 2'-phosphotransferase
VSVDGVTADSKFLSYVLRHNPGSIGLMLDDAGWTGIDALLAAAAGHGRRLDSEALQRVIDAPGKQRFEIRDGLIRAAQGHSIEVDLRLEPERPPAVLYHGTVQKFLASILAEGLKPGRRTHVHLSAGHEFFRAANGVWLTAQVPPTFISQDG